MYFIDTSVLLDILEVPNCESNQHEINKQKFIAILEDHLAKISITASVMIETGNHINHITSNYKAKRIECEKRFITFLQRLADTNDQTWNLSPNADVASLPDFIKTINQHFPQKVGIGDAMIINAYNKYCDKFRSEKGYPDCYKTEIWSIDNHLKGIKNYI